MAFGGVMQAQIADNHLSNWKPIAQRLSLSERAFWRAVHEGGLPYIKINSRVLRFRWSDVEHWLANRSRGEA